MSFLSILPSQTLNEIKEELSNVEVLKQKHPECEIKYFKGKLIETMKNYEK